MIKYNTNSVFVDYAHTPDAVINVLMKDHFGRKYVTEADLEKYQVQTAWNGTLLLLN